MANVRSTPLQFDIHRITEEVDRFINYHYLDPECFQICLTHPEKCEDPLYFGVGSLRGNGPGGLRATEEDFTVFYEGLRGTYLHEVYLKVKEWSPYKIGRVRICELQTRKCLSFHKDADIRYHIAVHTNPHALMFFEKDVESPYHIPADGTLYRTNTLLRHTVMNAHSDDYRYHLVFCAYDENEKYTALEW